MSWFLYIWTFVQDPSYRRVVLRTYFCCAFTPLPLSVPCGLVADRPIVCIYIFILDVVQIRVCVTVLACVHPYVDGVACIVVGHSSYTRRRHVAN